MKQYTSRELFTSRELSEKLVKLGCKSGCDYYYEWATPIKPTGWSLTQKDHKYYGMSQKDVPAFEFEDFCGTHEEAKENIKILAKRCYKYPTATAYLNIRVGLMMSDDWRKYLKKVMVGEEPKSWESSYRVVDENSGDVGIIPKSKLVAGMTATIKELIKEYDEAMVDDKGPRGSHDDIMEALKEAVKIIKIKVNTCSVSCNCGAAGWLEKNGFYNK